MVYSDYAINLMEKEGICKDKMYCIANSLDSDHDRKIRNYIKVTDTYKTHFNNDNPTIIYCGRIQKTKKLYLLARHTFKDFSNEEIIKYLKVFIKRFFTQQFKRNCVPDGVKVGSISLSPRGDLRMPSDMNFKSYLEEIEKIERENGNKKN